MSNSFDRTAAREAVIDAIIRSNDWPERGQASNDWAGTAWSLAAREADAVLDALAPFLAPSAAQMARSEAAQQIGGEPT